MLSTIWMWIPSSNHPATDSRFIRPTWCQTPPPPPSWANDRTLSWQCDHCSHSRQNTTFSVTTEPDCLASSVMEFNRSRADVIKLLHLLYLNRHTIRNMHKAFVKINFIKHITPHLTQLIPYTTDTLSLEQIVKWPLSRFSSLCRESRC
jgi:hypothetical protein